MKPNPHQPKSPQTFLGILFQNFWKSQEIIEPDISQLDIRSAIYHLRLFTGLTPKQLSIRINRSPSFLAMLETRNTSIKDTEVCESLRDLAVSYYLPTLARWFERRRNLEAHKRKAPKRWGI